MAVRFRTRASFQKILIVNGHGSNSSLIDLVARQTVLETHSLCAALNYFSLGREAFEGKVIWESVLSRLVELVDEFRAWPIAERADQHAGPVQSDIRW